MVVHYTTPRPNLSAFSFVDIRLEESARMSTVFGIELPNPIIKYFAGLLYLVLGLNGLALNLLWVGILFLGHRVFSQRPFYIVSRHLLISDVLCVLGQLGAAVPLTFMDYKTAISEYYCLNYVKH
jgi:hypothetical protein